MKYLVKTSGEPFYLYAVDDEMFFIGTEPIEMTIEQLGITGLNDKHLICTPIPDSGKPLVEAQPAPDGNPAFDVTQSTEVAAPMPDFEEPKTYTRPQPRRGNGKKRR